MTALEKFPVTSEVLSVSVGEGSLAGLSFCSYAAL